MTGPAVPAFAWAEASAADIERLIHEIQDTVRSETGVCLEAEVRIVGDPVQ